MFRESYAAVMDPKTNPLSAFPKIVTFQLMSMLAWMWSVVFCTWIGSMAMFGPSVAIHMILLVGVFVTAEVFAMARRRRAN